MTQILLDMDGVLANFLKQVCKYHNRHYSPELITKFNISEIWQLDADEFWEPLRGVNFWAEIEPYPWATALYQSLCEIAPVTICTAPSLDHECVAGKLKWLQNNLNVHQSDVVFANKKWLLANESHILIDDSQHKIEMFSKYGGNAIVFPQPWNDGEGDWWAVVERIKHEQFFSYRPFNKK